MHPMSRCTDAPYAPMRPCTLCADAPRQAAVATPVVLSRRFAAGASGGGAASSSRGVGVVHGDHLREVDEGDDAGVRHHEVELVEVAVHQPAARQAREDVRGAVEDGPGVRDVLHHVHGEAVHLLHEHAVARGVHGLRHHEAVPVEGLHERVLLERGQPAQVEPRAVLAVAQVVALLLDAPEADAAQAVQLERELLPVGVGREVDVRLLAHADAASDAADRAALYHGPQREEVVAAIGQAVAVVVLLFARDELEAAQLHHDLVEATVAESGKRCDEPEGNVLVVAHAHLDACQHAKVVLAHQPEVAHIELHARRPRGGGCGE
mmetsp:Transcript_2715/g.10920  ORF Transcript_2715/g.10920 Transcript_2715/m.10920 type:complete len:322 (+) Transcript_2715:51-1016(+)